MRKRAALAALTATLLGFGPASFPAYADEHTDSAAAVELAAQAEALAKAEATQRAYLNAQHAYLSSLMASDGWRTMEGGLRWRYVTYVGTGAKPTVVDTVTLHYAGTFIDGEGFDSSYDRGEPATFPLGSLIPAWRMAVPQMRVGETIEIAAPSNLAYGPRGRRTIPGGATLLFTIELIDIAER